MKIRLLTAAQRDLANGYRFYEAQEKGLGSYFLDSLYSDIDSLQVYAGIHTVVAGNYYRMFAKRFPFAVYYRMMETSVLVHAVLDCRRDPARNRKRLHLTS